jgi:hypothetical protein
MKQLGIEMITLFSTGTGAKRAAFSTHQGRLPRELAMYEITAMEAANRYLDEVYRPAFNAEFMQPAAD